MTIKRSNAITKADFEEALDYLGASISNIAQESGIPRAYLSDLKNRNIRLRREYEEKLRAYLLEKEVEFEDGQDPPRSAARTAHPRLKSSTVDRCHFPIANGLDEETIEQAMTVIEANDAQISTLLDQKATLDDDFFAGVLTEQGFSKETQSALAEIERLCAENYMLFRKLTGWRALRMTSAEKGKETIRDLVNEKNLPLFMEAGFFEAEATPKIALEEEAEAA